MSSSRHRPSPTGRRHAEMSTAGGAQNMAHLLRLRQEGKIPASAGGGVLGGQTSSRAASAGLRSGDGGGRRGGAPGFGFRRNMGQHPSLVERLRHTATLRGHSGCVNRLCWNDGGTRLASGSDDTTVCLFDAASGKNDLQFRTGHRRNILGVKILPCTDDQVIVTGARDGEVRLHKAPFSSPDLTDCFSCHRKRVHAVEVEPGNPFIFWSAGEDGTIRQYDRRLPNSGCGEGGGSSDEEQDSRKGGFHRRRRESNCLIRLPSPPPPGRCGGRRGPALEAEGGRAFHLACNPVDTNYLAVACGDYVARVFDRRVLSVGESGDSDGGGGGGGGYGQPPPALSFCPTGEHPAAGKAATSPTGGGSVGRGAGASPLASARHATCVAYSPDGRELLVSYQRDHVYLFDATGATRSSSAVSDPALSSYFIPALPPPPPPLSATTPRPPVRPATQRRASTATGGDGGRQGGGRFSGGAARAGHGEEPDAAGVTAGRVLEAHRALAAWDARGEPPVSLSRLAELYRRRSGELRERGWRGDGYMALLDAARAKELSPKDPQALWEYIEALVHVDRRPAARAEALRYLPTFPELRSRFEALLPAGLGTSRSHSTSDAGGGGGGATEDGQEATEEEEEEEGHAGGSEEELETPPRGSGGGGREEAGDSPRPARLTSLSVDLILSEEVAIAREWQEMLARKEGLEKDPRCPGGVTHAAGRGGGDARAATGAARGDWTESACQETERSRDMLNCSPRAMTQRYAGACNVRTVNKEASFIGDGGYVASGSDDGRVFIWERATGRLVRAFKADDHIVNCVAPHPSLPVLATSGIESVVRMWGPRGEDEAVIGEEEEAVSDLDSQSLEEIAQNNQGSMDAVSVNVAVQPLVHQLVLQLASEEDGGPGECIQT